MYGKRILSFESLDTLKPLNYKHLGNADEVFIRKLFGPEKVINIYDLGIEKVSAI